MIYNKEYMEWVKEKGFEVPATGGAGGPEVKGNVDLNWGVISTWTSEPIASMEKKEEPDWYNINWAYQSGSPAEPYKFNEAKLLQEFREYVLNTYKGHYVGKENIQSLDLIFASGRGEGFCIGNILKLAARYGKKDGKNRKDLLKILHYALLTMYLLDKEKEQQ